MELVPLDQLHIRPGRIRQEFDGRALHELANSIAQDGLFHPLTRDEEGFLLLGERRFKAIKMLAENNLGFHCNGQSIPPGVAPCFTYHHTDDAQLLQAELRENIIRADITWQEKASATARLFELQEAARAVAGLQLQDKNKVPALAETILVAKGKNVTASKLNGEARGIRQDLIVNSFLHDPEVAEAKSREEALKLIEKKLIQKHREALAKEYGNFQGEKHTLLQGNCIDLLPQLESGTFDVVLADPPYGVGIDSHATMQGGADHHYDDSPEAMWKVMHSLARELPRVTKEQAHLYLFCDFQFFEQLKELFSEKWDVWPRPLIWHRSDSTGMLPRAMHGPRKNYECILYAIKGNKRVVEVGNDVFSVTSEKGSHTPARKPVELLTQILRRSVSAGDRVLDPCCGSGPIFSAGDSLQCRVTGIELHPALVGLCAETLENLNGMG